jgi:glycosyltransferase involved in cell wall biosynthesis
LDSRERWLKNEIPVFSIKKRYQKRSFINAVLDFIKLVFLVLNKTNKNDILHCRAHGGAIVGFVISIIRGNKYIFDYRGNIILEAIDLGHMKKKSISIYLLSFLEKFLLKRASSIICVSNKQKYLFKKYKNVSVVYNATETFNINHTKITEEKLIKIAYIGNATNWHCVEELFILANKIEELGFEVKLKIATGKSSVFLKYSKLYNFKNIEIKYLSQNDVKDFVSDCDFGYCLIKNSKSKEVCFPVKFSEYVSAGIPVLINKNIGDLEEIVTNYNLGVCLKSPQKVNSISINQIQRFKQIRSDKVILPEILNWENVINKWKHIYENIDINRKI